jgi:YesN/AraC family two-component response regulator
MQLTTVLLADDDYLVIQDLKTLVDWEALGFHIIATARNGAKALEVFKKHRPQLVMSDVVMPGMDGLLFLENIKTIAPETTVLLISSFDDFDYVKAAIRGGADDYILKNEINAVTLSEKLRMIRSRLSISAENDDRMTRIILSDYLVSNVSLEMLTQKYPINERLFTRINDLLGKKLSYFLITYKKPLEFFSHSDEDKKAAGMELLRTFGEITQYKFDSPVGFYINDMLLVGLDLSSDAAYRRNEKNAAELRNAIQENLDIDIVCFYFPEKNNLPSVRDIFSVNVELILFFSVFPPEKKLIDFAMLKDERYVREKGLFNYTLLEYVNSESKERYFAALKKYFTTLNEKRDADTIARTFMHILQLYEEMAEETLPGKKPLFFCNIEELLAFLMRNYEWVITCIGKRQTMVTSRAVTRAIEFIKSNYSNPQLSIEDIAENVSLSVGRLSVVFKAETGKTVMDYLTDERIKQAVYLLKNTNLRIYEVSLRTGYRSSQYFSKVFFKKTGKRPIDFM